MLGFFATVKEAVSNILNDASSSMLICKSIDDGFGFPKDYIIAAHVKLATTKTWETQRRSINHPPVASDTSDISSANNRTESEPSTDTGITSSTGSDEQGQTRYLAEALKKEEELRTKLELKVTNFEQQLAKKDNRYKVLERKYTEQLKQRINDKAMVDQWCEEVMETRARCEEIEDAYQKSMDTAQKQVEEYQASIEARDQRQAKIIADHHSAMTAIQETHKAQLEAAIQKAAEDQEFTKAAHLKEVHALTKASKVNRAAWEKEKKVLEVKLKQMDGDARDARQANEDEILRLADCKRRLETENELLMKSLNSTSGDMNVELAHQLFLELQDTKGELHKTREDLHIANIKIENTLDAMQQQRDNYEAHGEEESEAQAQVCDLLRHTVGLEERLAICNDLLHNEDNEPAITDKDGSSKVVLRNQELLGQFEAFREENKELLAKSNKVDDENLALSMKIDTVEEQLHTLRRSHKIFQDNLRNLRRERTIFSNAVNSHSGLTAEDKEALHSHLRNMTEQNEELRTANDELLQENKDLVAKMEKIEEECRYEVKNHQTEANRWYDFYFDEAVPKVERLTQEIDLLNRQLGRTTDEAPPLQERLSRNVVVSNRNALRYACEYGVRGVDTAQIPAEYHEPGLTPGWIPATYDALRLLRPLGWIPISELGKFWLAPMYKPFTEEDAAARLEAEEQVERRAHRVDTGYPKFPENEETVEYIQNDRMRRSRVSTVMSEEPVAPEYNPVWQKKRAELTQEAYELMDTMLKLDVLKMLGLEIE